MYLDKISIKSNLKDYDVYFENDSGFVQKLADIENAVFIVDENVWKLHKDKNLRALPAERVIVLPVREEVKNIDTVCALYEKIMAYSPRKNMNLISIGGGIIQDITGFVASSLYRGINWIFVPTTLLAQVDSCIGAKTSLNFKQFKNLVGTFYAPKEIHIFPEFLQTLHQEDFYSGIGEMAKLHLMAGAEKTREFIAALPGLDKRENAVLSRLTHNCLHIKKSYIEEDEFDTGRRNLLNYGHCFGHAVESATNFAVPHGQAVVLGMMLANKVSVARGVLSPENEAFVLQNVLQPVLKVRPSALKHDAVLSAMHQDKKNVGKGLALIMLKDNYQMEKIVDMTEAEARSALAALGF